MSRLYYRSRIVVESEVLEIVEQVLPDASRAMRPNRLADHGCTDVAVIRATRARVPQPPADRAGRIKSFNLPKQGQAFVRDFRSAISGFRSLCGRKQRSSLSHRAQIDLPVGTFTRTGSLARFLASCRKSAGRANPV